MPWHQDCYQGVMRYGEEHGWRCSLDLYAVGLGGDFSRTSYNGVVGRIPTHVAERVAQLGLPMVTLTPYVETNNPDQATNLPGVLIHREEAVRLSVEHMAQVGYRRLGVMVQGGTDGDQFIDLARRQCSAFRMKWVEPFVFSPHSAQSPDTYVQMLVTLNDWLAHVQKPIGLVVNRTTHARVVAHACIEQGLRVPEEVGIVTPSGDQTMLTSSSPTISGVEFDFYRQGYEAAAMLDKMMSGQPVEQTQVLLPPSELVVRESTDVFLCEDKLVSQAMRYIAANLHEELSVNTVADAVGVSRWTLHRRFEQVLGKTPQQEISRLRVGYIKRLLTETDQPIASVGTACGFSTASHFTRYFKRETGLTPSKYRELA